MPSEGSVEGFMKMKTRILAVHVEAEGSYAMLLRYESLWFTMKLQDNQEIIGIRMKQTCF